MHYLPINGWTKQAIIDKIEKEFTFKSTDGRIGDDNCVYRGESNGMVTRCAVGLFIPDDKYEPKMETVSASAVINQYGLNNLMPLNSDEMTDMQLVHDNSDPKDTKVQLIKWINDNVAE